jgi:hypothetical protein
MLAARIAAQNSWVTRNCRTLTTALIGGLIILLIALSTPANAHPEDDFCEGEISINFELCQQLAQLNSADGPLTVPLTDDAGNILTPLEAAVYFGEIGVRHILPGGLDHILFVLALFLAARTLRSLILQISVFTVAHTVTLGMTAAGVLNPPASIVEPLIALSIAVVAVETLFKFEKPRWRLLIIFGFGLFHGMGFAGFISEIGLPPEQFWPSLIGFNIGVEIGQLSVVLAAVLLAIPVKRWVLTTDNLYRRGVVIPGSLIIAAIGFWWFLSRSLGL